MARVAAKCCGLMPGGKPARGLAAGLVLLMLGCCAGLASAQQTSPEPGAQEKSSEPGLQEIVVTAEKRKERLQDVPIAITAVTGDTLDRAGVRDIGGLTASTPNV